MRYRMAGGGPVTFNYVKWLLLPKAPRKCYLLIQKKPSYITKLVI